MSLADARPLLERADSQVLDDRSTRAEARRWYVLFVYSYLSGLQSLVWCVHAGVRGWVGMPHALSRSSRSPGAQVYVWLSAGRVAGLLHMHKRND